MPNEVTEKKHNTVDVFDDNNIVLEGSSVQVWQVTGVEIKKCQRLPIKILIWITDGVQGQKCLIILFGPLSTDITLLIFSFVCT